VLLTLLIFLSGNLFGPVPPAGSKLFAGKFFLLTSSDMKHLCTKREDAEGNSHTFGLICLTFGSAVMMKYIYIFFFILWLKKVIMIISLNSAE
jgi:hypothetical protein